MNNVNRTLFVFVASACAAICFSACGGDNGTGSGDGTDSGDIAPLDTVEIDTTVDVAPLDVTTLDVDDTGQDTGQDTDTDTGGSNSCDEDIDCEIGEVCVDLLPGPDNGFCTVRCTSDDDCPDELDCVVVGTGEISYEACLDVDFCLDQDEDGYGTGPGCRGPDCDDLTAAINPGADEVCNNTDDDCDGEVDDNTLTSGDDCETGFDGVCGEGRVTCIDGSDQCIARYEAGAELCDGDDNDCDGEVDEEATDATTWYNDGDSDRFGDDAVVLISCQQPAGYVDDGGDCDDTASGINPVANEICDGVDNNCNGTIDGPDAAGSATFYEDLDGDGFGDPDTERGGCAEEGWVTNDRDCDDEDDAINPDALDICDLIDNDCDGVPDNGGDTERQWFRDADGDGYGDAGDERFGCGEPGWVSNSDDCNDDNDAVYPGAEDICDGFDNDCNGTPDDGAVPARTWYRDGDNDGFGDLEETRFGCAEDGWVTDASDCDDARGFINPSREDVCDGYDNDCSGTPDDGPVPARTYYEDFDRDGFGDPDESRFGCAEDGWVTNDRDCDDARNFINPSREDVCDGYDNDCNGTPDDGPVPARLYYEDTDFDGYGDPATERLGCAEDGWVTNDRDCNDDNRNINPTIEDVCDGIDNDCNGTPDDGPIPARTYYADEDEDTFGDPDNSRVGCEEDGWVTNDRDCNDDNAGVHPNADDVCDGADNDCSGTPDDDPAFGSTWYLDGDSDTYGDPAVTAIACTAPAGYIARAQDCDDAAAGVNPAATEVCNGVDDNCRNGIDEGVGTIYFRDGDNDGYGNAAMPIEACTQPTGYVADATDCNDANGDAFPGNPEVCDGVDNDCAGGIDNGAGTDWYLDNDGDGQGGSSTVTACTQPPGTSTETGDCNDNNANVYTGAQEMCGTSYDDDCDGDINEGVTYTPFGGDAPPDATMFYIDSDDDGQGDEDAPNFVLSPLSVLACPPPRSLCLGVWLGPFCLGEQFDYVANRLDCDDSSARAQTPTTTPRQEVVDGYDNECNGTRDDGLGCTHNTYCYDSDGDGYGDASREISACVKPVDNPGRWTDADHCGDADDDDSGVW